MTPNNILITGASGLIGTRLTELLLAKGYQVSHLSRRRQQGKVPVYQWDIYNREIDEEALFNAECIIHLAGAGVADQPWTKRRKQEIRDSRIKSTSFLHDCLNQYPNKVKTFIGASAFGYYGFGLDNEPYTEEMPPANDYLATVVKDWEAEVDRLDSQKFRVVKIRIAIVLSEKGGALKEMMKPVQLYAGAALGTGKQIMSWIHIDDVCNMFIHAIENQNMHGAYNAVAPHPVTNYEFIHQIAEVIDKPMFLPNVPKFFMKMLLGEMADMVLYGRNISSKKIQSTGFKFQYEFLKDALKNLLQKK